MAGVKLNFTPTGPTIRGFTQNEEVHVMLIPSPKSYQGYTYTEGGADYSITKVIDAYSTTDEPDITLTGYAEGAKVDILDFNGATSAGVLSLEGNHIKQIVSSNLQNSTVRIKVTTRYTSKVKDYSFASVGEDDAIQDIDVVFATGSLSEEILDCVKDLLPVGGATVGTNCQFNGGVGAADNLYEAGNVVVEDNPTFFLAAMDWSGISLAYKNELQEEVGYIYPFTLISPRHVLFAAHTKGNTVGTTITFRRPNGTTQTVTVLSEARAPAEASGSSPDIGLAYLSEPIVGCGVFKIPPADFTKYFPVQQTTLGSVPYRHIGVPTIVRVANTGIYGDTLYGHIFLDRHSPKFISTNSIRFVPIPGDTSLVYTYELVPKDSLLASHYRGIYGGDSGSPSFWMIRETAEATPTPVLVSAYYIGEGGEKSFSAGPHYAVYSSWIQAQMDALAVANGDTPIYTLTYANFSRFNSYVV